jgi:hypothetical protein
MVLDNRQEDKRFWTERYQTLPEFILLLIFSLIKFWFLTDVPKYWTVLHFQSIYYLYVRI